MGQNDGGIKRGDRADTGDLRANPTNPDADNSAGRVNDKEFRSSDAFPIGGLTDLTVKEAGDPTLGMTNVGGRDVEDWAADTGPTRTGEGEVNIATRELSDDGSTLVGDHHMREHSPDEGDFPLKEEKPKKAPAKRTTTAKKKKAG